MLLSKYLGFEDELEALGVFDCLLDEDSNFFINVVLLKNTNVPEFKDSYNKILRMFDRILLLLDSSYVIGDKLYRQAYKMFKFDEMNEIGLGFAVNNGSSFGPRLREKIINDAFDIVKAGCKKPEVFLLMELFEEKVGPDRISDMIGSIIKDDIIEYTKRINRQLNINSEKYKDKTFENGFLINEIKNRKIYYLPKSILNKIPIAKEWSDIDDVVSKNEFIRREINSAIAEEWYNLSTAKKKHAILRDIILIPDKCEKAIEEYKKCDVDEISPREDFRYGSKEIFEKRIIPNTNFSVENIDDINSLRAGHDILNLFRDWVENNKGWAPILDFPSTSREKFVQRLIHLSAKSYSITNNIDLNFEPNEGKGPVDFKLSIGNNDKTVIEIKLSSNGQYLHGYETQIIEYAKSENTNQMIYVFVDIGNPGRLEKIKKLHQNKIENNKDHPELFIISSISQASASVK